MIGCTVTDGEGNRTSYEYDGLDRLRRQRRGGAVLRPAGEPYF